MTDDIMPTARAQMSDAYEADYQNRIRAEDDLQFVIGEQYPADVRAQRQQEGKPCLTFNGLANAVRQVTAQVRNLNPAIKVTPSDNEATDDVAEVYGGLVRQIENKCDATSTYEAAAESAAMCGIGWFRARTDYCYADSFEQEIIIDRIPNPFSVFVDPLAKDPTRKDARYMFVAEEVAREDFKEQYPKASLEDATGDHRPEWYENWYRGETVVVAEYFRVEYDEFEIVNVQGRAVRADELPEFFYDMDPRTGKKFERRKARKPKVVWRKISGHEVLEGPIEMACEQIPVFAVTGEEIHVGEEMYRSSVVRYAKDAQVLYNLARSSQAEVTMLQPRAPWLVTSKQVEGLEEYWKEANTSNRAYLPYIPDEKAPPPTRIQPPVSSQGLSTEAQLAAEDIKRTTGIYDAALGARSNETSGVAIQRRQAESGNSTSVYADNMVKAVAQCGRVICQMIPKVYDTARVIRILGEDSQEKAVQINFPVQTQQGHAVYNDLTAGKYDVRISVGPAYQTMKQEAADAQMEFLRTMPQVAPLIADLIAGNQPWPEADRIAERLRKTLPPGMEEEDDQQNDPRAMQAQQAQQMQAQQQQQAAQAAMQMDMAKREAEVKKAQAEAVEAEADARKAQADAVRAEVETRAMMAGAGVFPPQMPFQG